MTDLIFLDTETTGLEQDKHEVWEVAWAVNDGPVETRIVVHSLKTANFDSLEINKYLERFPQGARSEGPLVDLEIRRVLEKNTLVCANPPFDRGFLFQRWGYEPWHHRSIDIESMALLVFGWERPRGLKDVAAELRQRMYNIPDPDHTAGVDVEVLRACYNALRVENDRYKIY